MGTRFVFLGPPGAGKGTQSTLASTWLHIPKIAAGDLLRSEIAKGGDLGKRIAEFINVGLLVPDELANSIVLDRIASDDSQRGFLLDGYPRSLVQAEALETFLDSKKLALDRVLYFKVEAAVVIERMSHRRICKACATSYNLVTQQPLKEGICDRCGGELIMRADDKPESIRRRIEIYKKTTEPLLKHYEEKSLLTTLEAKQQVDAVAEQVAAICRER